MIKKISADACSLHLFLLVSDVLLLGKFFPPELLKYYPIWKKSINASKIFDLTLKSFHLSQWDALQCLPGKNNHNLQNKELLDHSLLLVLAGNRKVGFPEKAEEKQHLCCPLLVRG